MKLLFLISIAFILDPSCFINGKGYQGYIFPESYFILMTVKNQKERFTPTKNDVQKAEELLNKQIEILNIEQINQVGNCPIIHKKLKKYKRQYVGFLNIDGEKIIWINLIWFKDFDSILSKEIVSVQDGCSFFWNIKVNINDGSVFDLNINGLG